jgi:hypothetical protein
MSNDTPSMGRHAADIGSASHVIMALAEQLDTFLTEVRAGELTIMREGKNVLAERADSAQTILVAASRIRTHLASVESVADQVIHKAETRREDTMNDFFGAEDSGT